MKHIKWIVIGVIIIAVAASMLLKKGIPVQVAKVKTGSIKEYVEERAKTSLPHVYHLTMPLEGRILPITLKAGTEVKKGDVVARIDQADLLTAQKRVEAEISAIKSQIAVNEYNALEKTALTESTDWIKTMAELVKSTQKKILANQQVYDYSLDYENTLKASGEAVSRIKNSEARKDTAVAKVETETAEINYNAMKLMQKIFDLCPTYINQFLTRKKLVRNIFEADLGNAKAKLEKIKRDLNRTIIKSPIDGVVLKRFVSNERFLPPSTPLLDIGNLATLEVTAGILSQEVVKVKQGNVVDIYGAAIGKTPIKGSVNRIKPEGYTKISSLGVEQQRVHVIISIDQASMTAFAKQGRLLGDGYRVQVRIYTATADNALIVPRTALFKGNDGSWELFIVKDGKAMLQNVQIGLINDEKAQILNGISEHDSVIIAPPASLTSGTKVSY
jgi:HlyD family secretion protein